MGRSADQGHATGCELHSTAGVAWQGKDAPLTKCALGPDEQLLQVKAGVVLAQHAQQVEHRAVCQSNLHAQNAAVKGSVAQEPQAAFGAGGWGMAVVRAGP